jgi:hypothetical protein
MAALSALLTFASAAQACTGSGNVYSDDFTDDSGGWVADSSITFGPKGASVTLGKPTTAFQELNTTFDLPTDASICADVTLIDKPGLNPVGGIIFWAKDYSNLYAYWVTGGGEYQIWRKNNNAWTKVTAAPAPGLKMGPGTTNDLSLTIKGSVVTVSLNGTELKRIRAQPPEGTSRFGFYTQLDKAVAAEDDPVVEMFTGYKVSKAN